MAFQLAEYPVQSQKLIKAGRHLLDALQDDEIDQNIAVTDLETAAASRLPADSRLGFSAESSAAATDAAKFTTLEDALGAAMLELQSANVLMSAGVALGEHGGGADRKLLQHALADVDASKTAVGAAISSSATLRFAAAAEPSETIDAAVTLFQGNAGKALDAISDGTVSIIESSVSQLKDIEAAKVLDAINRLGQSFDVGVAAGRLIKHGIHKLKSVLDSLSALFGPEAFASIKAKVEEIWKKITGGDYTRAAVRWTLAIDSVESRVKEIALLKNLTISSLDGVSRGLAMLDDEYQRLLKILNGIVSAIVVAMGVLAFLHMVGPWVAIVGAAAYVCVLGAAVLAGMSYSGAMTIGSVHGVRKLIESADMSPNP